MKQILIKDLSKRYGANIVIKNIRTELNSKYIYFLISENGSGKTTFFKCLLRETKYHGYIADNDMKYVFMPEKVRFPYVLSILDYFKMFLENDYDKDFEKVVDEYLHYFGIYKYKYQYINRLSKGTKQKILIIKTILSNADVYLLDEPLAGLDKTSRLLFMSLIKLLQEKDKIIIIASHYYDEYPFDNKKVIDLK